MTTILPRVSLPNPFVNSAGTIQNITLDGCQSVAHIHSRARTVRANHWHRTDSHRTYVVSGAVIYLERAVGSTEMPEPWVFLAGEAFDTPAEREHAMVFPVETDIITTAPKRRDTENHEADVVRVEFITSELVGKLCNRCLASHGWGEPFVREP